MKKIYNAPVVEIKKIEKEDVLTSSNPPLMDWD